MQVSHLLDIDPQDGGVAPHNIKYFVASAKFVTINGVSYPQAESAENLIG